MVRWLALLGLVLLVAGCKPQPRFLGTWNSGAATLSVNSDGVVVMGNSLSTQRGKWQAAGEMFTAEFDGEAGIRRSKWWVSEDGKTLTLTPIDANGAEMKDQVVTYLRQ